MWLPETGFPSWGEERKMGERTRPLARTIRRFVESRSCPRLVHWPPVPQLEDDSLWPGFEVRSLQLAALVCFPLKMEAVLLTLCGWIRRPLLGKTALKATSPKTLSIGGRRCEAIAERLNTIFILRMQLTMAPLDRIRCHFKDEAPLFILLGLLDMGYPGCKRCKYS